MKKVVLLASLILSACGQSVVATPTVEDQYNRSCISCHLAGAAGAPKTGDAAAWQPRMEKGMDVLVANVKKGINAMPPKGMCFDCSDEEYAALIDYMAAPKQ